MAHRKAKLSARSVSCVGPKWCSVATQRRNSLRKKTPYVVKLADRHAWYLAYSCVSRQVERAGGAAHVSIAATAHLAVPLAGLLQLAQRRPLTCGLLARKRRWSARASMDGNVVASMYECGGVCSCALGEPNRMGTCPEMYPTKSYRGGVGSAVAAAAAT